MRLHAFINANLEPILQDWEDFARSLGGVTATMDTAALRDHAALILKNIATDLKTSQTPAQQEAKSQGDAPERGADLPPTAATSHGVLRAEDGFSLEEMVSEFRALRASVLRLWAKVQTTPDPDSFQELMRFNEAIDEALADSIRTYSLALDHLAVSKARHRMESLGTLSAGLGHDMANVLLPMRACLGVLERQSLPSAAAPFITSLNRAAAHLDGLAKGLRALSMDPDNPAGAAHSTLLHEWWSTAISPFTWALPPGVQLKVQGLGESAPLPPVAIPAHALMQAVFNLVQNAAQALGRRNAESPSDKAPQGGNYAGNIWVTAILEPATNSAPNADAVRLTIRDDGPGMDAGTMAQCTELFFTTKAHHQGTGLGLFLVRSTIERYGGRLLVESKPGHGAAFTLLLSTAPLPALQEALPTAGAR